MLREPGEREAGRGTHPRRLWKTSRRRQHLSWVLRNSMSLGYSPICGFLSGQAVPCGLLKGELLSPRIPNLSRCLPDMCWEHLPLEGEG